MAEEPIDRLPTIPDKVVDKVRAGKSVPLEEVVSESSLEAIHTQNAARKAPVRMDGLRSISKAEAASRVTFDGDSLPRAPATRRVLPAPFQRHVINLTVPGEPKPEWRYLRADQVQVGDIVPGVGRVEHITRWTGRDTVGGVYGVAVTARVTLTGPEGLELVAGFEEQVQVFSLARPDT